MAAQQRAIVDKLLTNVSQMVRPMGFICDEVLPYLASKQRTGELGDYGTGHLREIDSEVGGDGEFKRVRSITRDKDNFRIKKYGIYNNVTEDDYINVEQPFAAEVDEVIGLTSITKIKKELTLKALLETGVQGESIAMGKRFDEEGADPFESIPKAENTVLQESGAAHDLVIIPRLVYNFVIHNPAVRAYYRGGANSANTGGPVGMEEVKKLFNTQRLLVPQVPMADSEGSIQQLWGKDIYFLVAPKTAQKYQICFGYRMGLTRRGGKPYVYKFRTTNPPNGTQILVGDDYSYVEANPACIYKMSNAIS